MKNAFGQPQSVVVLGGTSEIALATVAALIESRTRRVVLAGRDASALEARAEELRTAGAEQVAVVAFDASDPSGADACIEACLEAAGGSVDLVLLAVGQLGQQSELDDDPVATAKLFDVNLTWPAAAMAALRPRLVAQGTGQLCVIGSVAGVRPRRSIYTYGATKSGLDAYTRGYADSLRPEGIKVQVVRPGFVRTKMTTGLDEAPFTTSADEAAGYIVKGLSSSATVIWSPPVLRVVFTLLRHLPGFVWRRLPA